MASSPLRLTDGLNNNDDAAFIRPTQLRKAIGCRYAPSSPLLRRSRGRTVFNSENPGSGAFSSITSVDFNEASVQDSVIFQRGTDIFSIPSGAAGVSSPLNDQKEFLSLVDAPLQRTASVNPLTATKLEDIWLVVDGTNRPIVLENNGRGRVVGLLQPTGSLAIAEAPVGGTFSRAESAAVTQITGGNQFFPRVNDVDGLDGGFDTVANSDGVAPQDTFEEYIVIVGTPPSLIRREFSWVGAGSSTLAWNLFVSYSASGISLGGFSAVFEAKIAGVDTNFREIANLDLSAQNREFFFPINFQVAFGDNIAVDQEDVTIRLTFRGDIGGTSAGLQLFDISLSNGTAVSVLTFTEKAGIRYAHTEIRDYQRRLPGSTAPISIGLESALSALSPPSGTPPLVFVAPGRAGNIITTPAATNAESTRRRIYRSIDATTEEESLAWDRFSAMVDLDITATEWVDRMDDGGKSLDFQDPTQAPPFLVVNGFLTHSNLPPSAATDIVGSFQGSALYASPDFPGIFRWSIPLQPDYVPETYRTSIPGQATAFADIGVLVVFSRQSVTIFQFLPLANDSDFSPFREARTISTSRGCVSRRGMTVVDIPGVEKLAIFVAGDGIYLTTGAVITLVTPMIDWPVTLNTAQLSNSELIHDGSERRFIFTYEDNDGARQALDFYYGRSPQDITNVLGPRPWPNDGSTTLFVNNVIEVYTLNDGVIYRENQDGEDAARLENTSGTILFNPQTAQLFPFGIDAVGKIKRVLVRTPAADADLTVLFNHAIDTEPESSGTQETTIDLSEDGWKEILIDPDHQRLESFNLEFKATSDAFPGISALSVHFEKTGELTTLRGASA